MNAKNTNKWSFHHWIWLIASLLCACFIALILSLFCSQLTVVVGIDGWVITSIEQSAKRGNQKHRSLTRNQCQQTIEPESMLCTQAAIKAGIRDLCNNMKWCKSVLNWHFQKIQMTDMTTKLKRVFPPKRTNLPNQVLHDWEASFWGENRTCILNNRNPHSSGKP